MKLKIVFGTRPEIIKCAPIILEAQKRGHNTQVIFTGQHQEMAWPLLKFFEIRPDYSFNVMRPHQNLAALSSGILSHLNTVSKMDEDFILVQGDTTTAFMAAYWGFCLNRKIVHLEAGLRTYNAKSPYPEEINRQLIARMIDIHFAPTEKAKQSLLQEKLSTDRIFKIGNTAIDALKLSLAKIEQEHMNLNENLLKLIDHKKIVIITIHRRESAGKGYQNIATAIATLAQKFPNIVFIFPVHLNPNVRSIMSATLKGFENIHLCEPLDYFTFISLMQKASLILTDSGGIQEEAPYLKVPVLVLRDVTERMEAVELGHAHLVGTEPERIISLASQILTTHYINHNPNPYGDGSSASKAIDILESLC
jgi:UDP-N-acetylglucosamine 2-epimerase (non-hydrolysing)